MKWLVLIVIAALPAAAYAFGNSPHNTFWDDVAVTYLLLGVFFYLAWLVRKWWNSP